MQRTALGILCFATLLQLADGASAIASTLVATNTDDAGPGSLRALIAAATAGDTLDLTGLSGTIALASGELLVDKSLTIQGPGAKILSVSGSHLFRVFDVTAAAPATVDISGLTIRDGKPQGGTSGGGGILFNGGASFGTYRLTECEIRENDASTAGNPLGGGIDNEGGNVSIQRCAIVDNTATFRGGGIQNQGFGSMTIVNSTIAGNSAGTTGIGGAIRNLLPLTLVNCTIVGNSAQTAGNVSRSGGTINLQNTIIAGGILLGVGGSGPDINGGGFNSLDYNLIEDTATGTITGTTTHNLTGVSPMVGPLADNGGPTRTLALLPGSPAIDAGSAVTDPLTSLALAVDQRGNRRPADEPPAGGSGNASDIGAFEFQTAPTLSAIARQSTRPDTPITGLAFTVGDDTPLASLMLGATSDNQQVLTNAHIVLGGTGADRTLTLMPTPGAIGMATVSIGVSDGIYLTTTSFTLTVDTAPVIGSGTATPDHTVAGLDVAFAASATDADGQPLTYTWDFADGSTASGATASHAFATPGVYVVTLTVGDGLLTTSAGVSVTVFAPPLVGTGNDGDGDGFSDEFEAGALTDPNDAASTPTGEPASAGSIEALVVSKASIKLNFATGGRDAIQFGGTLPIPAGFTAAGKQMLVDVGGVFERFTLDAKGGARSGKNKLTVKIKAKHGVIAAQTAKFTAVFAKGTFAPAFADEGLTGDADVKPAKRVRMSFVIMHDDVVAQVQRDLAYTAKKGKTGKAK